MFVLDVGSFFCDKYVRPHKLKYRFNSHICYVPVGRDHIYSAEKVDYDFCYDMYALAWGVLGNVTIP